MDRNAPRPSPSAAPLPRMRTDLPPTPQRAASRGPADTRPDAGTPPRATDPRAVPKTASHGECATRQDPALARPRPRRRPVLPAAALAGALALAPGAAAASLACGPGREDLNLASPLLGAVDEPIATDTRPWFYGRCERPDEPLACALVTSGESIEVGVDGLDRACAAEGAHLLRLVPARHLTPSRTYTLECASTPLDLVNFNPERGLTTRDDDTPSLPPPPLADLIAVRRHQDDSGCCGDPIYTDLLVPEEPVLRDFLDDGGILEVRLARGEPWVQRDLPELRLPAVDGDIVVTAVGADGVRGQPFTIADDAIREELVYLDCRVGGRGTLGLWLLVPLAWLAWGRRRAREVKP